MTIDLSAAEALVAESAQSFSEGLRRLVQKAASEAKLERLQLAEEARRLDDLRLSLEEDRRRLDRGFARLSEERGALEVSDSLGESLSPIRRQTRGEPCSPLDIEADAGAGRGIHFLSSSGGINAPPAAAVVEDCQGTLTQCSDDALVSVLSGRCSSREVAGKGGRVLVEVRSSALVPFLERLAGDGCQASTGYTASTQASTQVGCGSEQRLLQLLDKFSLQGCIYQDLAQNLLVDSLLAFRGRRYAVLPPAGPEEAAVLLDMYDVSVTVPPGWEVLCTDQPGFDDAMGELSKHGWGTSLLCVKNSEGGFTSYRTVLYTHGGQAGTKVSGDSRVLQAGDGNDHASKTYKFSKGMVLSGRLVICSSSTAREGRLPPTPRSWETQR